MPNLCTAQIPLKDITRIQIYINKTPRKSLAAIKKATGADYILNGTLYNMSTGEVVCHLKADGKVICGPEYQVEGFAWDNPSNFKMELLPNVPKFGDIAKDNYIACSNLIVHGKPNPRPCNDPARNGKRGRSAIGIKDGCLCLYCSKDGSTDARTPERLRDDLLDAGWDDAIMLDGGGSSQCDFLGSKVTSTRKVQHLILVYLKNPACPYTEPKTLIKSGSKGDGAKWVQWFLNKHGADLVVDGIFGAKSLAALKAFQKSKKLTVDGLCGPATRAVLKS
jgi:hypothetical protein